MVISVENLAKSYRLGQIGAGTFREAIARGWHRMRGRDPEEWLGTLDSDVEGSRDYASFRRAQERSGAWRETKETSRSSIRHTENGYLWALRDVSFNVEQGEILGVIGKNGAGKSTLLKILTRITEPTQGRAVLRGRTASLLEVGTGFHPDLTGRENVYLNGTILGMTRREITSRFDAIIDFSGIEPFIDTPVKRYSSGMYVRLAFAVAAHLEPEILLVDEVLAVGDIAFQRKCIGKMSDISSEGRTVLFVSHNLASIVAMCSRCLVVDEGRIAYDGDPDEAVRRYLGLNESVAGDIRWDEGAPCPETDAVRLRRVRVYQDGEALPSGAVDRMRETYIEIEYEAKRGGDHLMPAIWLKEHTGTPVLCSANVPGFNLIQDAWYDRAYEKGIYRSVCTIPACFLNARGYLVTAIIGDTNGMAHIHEEDLLSFVANDLGDSGRPRGASDVLGVIWPKLSWRTEAAAGNDDSCGGVV